MMPNRSAVRKPTTTAAQAAKMERARKLLEEAQSESRGSRDNGKPTMVKRARNQEKSANEEMQDYESMTSAGGSYSDTEEAKPIRMRKGGMVTARGQGCVMKKKHTRMS
jgi:hypothetical protein